MTAIDKLKEAYEKTAKSKGIVTLERGIWIELLAAIHIRDKWKSRMYNALTKSTENEITIPHTDAHRIACLVVEQKYVGESDETFLTSLESKIA